LPAINAAALLNTRSNVLCCGRIGYQEYISWWRQFPHPWAFAVPTEWAGAAAGARRSRPPRNDIRVSLHIEASR
jgi:hypothetical protein